MKKFKNRWEILSNWQLIFPILGTVSLLFSAYLMSEKLVTKLLNLTEVDHSYTLFIFLTTLLFFILLLSGTLWVFKALEKKWAVTYRWEMIAIFMVFAITGSTAAKISDPIISLLGIHKELTNGWMYWSFRILLIFPIYQLLLVFVGWAFGQFKFFWEFEKKMLSRLGFSRFFKD